MLVVAELPWIAAETGTLGALQQRYPTPRHSFSHELALHQPQSPPLPLIHARNDAAGAAADAAAAGKVRFGLWDSSGHISRLQLTVALSMAIDIDETKVHVTVEESHFFSIEVDSASWLVAAINGDADFLTALNAQASVFDAHLVVSHAAVLVALVALVTALPPAPISPSADAFVDTTIHNNTDARA